MVWDSYDTSLEEIVLLQDLHNFFLFDALSTLDEFSGFLNSQFLKLALLSVHIYLVVRVILVHFKQLNNIIGLNLIQALLQHDLYHFLRHQWRQYDGFTLLNWLWNCCSS